MKFPFVFKSPNAGVFSEQWHFETKPVLCGGASLLVTLRGVALQKDKFKNQRTEIEVRYGCVHAIVHACMRMCVCVCVCVCVFLCHRERARDYIDHVL